MKNNNNNNQKTKIQREAFQQRLVEYKNNNIKITALEKKIQSKEEEKKTPTNMNLYLFKVKEKYYFFFLLLIKFYGNLWLRKFISLLNAVLLLL